MGKLGRKQQRQETKRRWKEQAQAAKQPGFQGFCEAARHDYEAIENVACCEACHANSEQLSHAEDGDGHYVVCCAVRHALCPNDREKRLHPPVRAELEPPRELGLPEVVRLTPAELVELYPEPREVVRDERGEAPESA